MNFYYLHRGGQTFGLYSHADLQTHIQTGSIQPNELMTIAGTDDWQPAIAFIQGVQAPSQQKPAPTPTRPLNTSPTAGPRTRPLAAAAKTRPLSTGPLARQHHTTRMMRPAAPTQPVQPTTTPLPGVPAATPAAQPHQGYVPGHLSPPSSQPASLSPTPVTNGAPGTMGLSPDMIPQPEGFPAQQAPQGRISAVSHPTPTPMGPSTIPLAVNRNPHAAQPTQPAQPAQPTQPAQPAQPTQPAQSLTPTELVPPAQSTQSAKSAPPTELVPPAKSTQPAKSATPTQTAQTAAVSQPAKPADKVATAAMPNKAVAKPSLPPTEESKPEPPKTTASGKGETQKATASPPVTADENPSDPPQTAEAKESAKPAGVPIKRPALAKTNPLAKAKEGTDSVATQPKANPLFAQTSAPPKGGANGSSENDAKGASAVNAVAGAATGVGLPGSPGYSPANSAQNKAAETDRVFTSPLKIAGWITTVMGILCAISGIIGFLTPLPPELVELLKEQSPGLHKIVTGSMTTIYAITITLGVLVALSGILLLKRKRAGHIMCIICSIIGIANPLMIVTLICCLLKSSRAYFKPS